MKSEEFSSWASVCQLHLCIILYMRRLGSYAASKKLLIDPNNPIFGNWLEICPISGSAEGFKQADSAINQAAKTGRWVLLKNVHLAPQWLAGIEKKLHSLTPNPSFRLFLTCEITPKLPMNLVRAGRVFVFEPTPGVKANLMRTFAELPASRITRVRSSH